MLPRGFTVTCDWGRCVNPRGTSDTTFPQSPLRGSKRIPQSLCIQATRAHKPNTALRDRLDKSAHVFSRMNPELEMEHKRLRKAARTSADGAPQPPTRSVPLLTCSVLQRTHADSELLCNPKPNQRFATNKAEACSTSEAISDLLPSQRQIEAPGRQKAAPSEPPAPSAGSPRTLSSPTSPALTPNPRIQSCVILQARPLQFSTLLIKIPIHRGHPARLGTTAKGSRRSPLPLRHASNRGHVTHIVRLREFHELSR